MSLVFLLILQIALFLFALCPFIGGEFYLIGEVEYNFYNIFNKLGNFNYYTINLLFIINFILIIVIMYRQSIGMKSTLTSVMLLFSYIIITLGCFLVSFAFLDEYGNKIYETRWGAYVSGIIGIVCFILSIFVINSCRICDLAINTEKNNKENQIKVMHNEIKELKSKLGIEEVESNEVKVNEANTPLKQTVSNIADSPTVFEYYADLSQQKLSPKKKKDIASKELIYIENLFEQGMLTRKEYEQRKKELSEIINS